jgi:DNA-binding NarL/FixJ family response regulator
VSRTPTSERFAVLLDRHPLWLEAVERVVQRTGVAVVGRATSPAIALELVGAHQPDLFVTGLEMGDGEIDGVTCVRRARELDPDLRVVVVSMRTEPEWIDAALDAGAFAYVFKTAHPDDLASAIRQVFDHSVYIAARPSQPAETQGEPSLGPNERLPSLTRREREILRLVAEGYSNSRVASTLFVTEQTVKFHLSNIYRKVNAANRTEAARWAQLHGLLEGGSPHRQLVA